MDTDVKEQLVKSIDIIKNKIKVIQNEEDAATLKFKKVFKPITEPLETLIKVNKSVSPNSNISQSSNKNRTFGDLNVSLEYEGFKDFIKNDSNEGSEYYEYTDDENNDENSIVSLNNTLSSLKKEDVIDMYGNINVPFGIRSQNKQFMMGDTLVHFSVQNNGTNNETKYIVTIEDEKYELTPGLKELLVRNKPNLALVTENDKSIYKGMLDKTNAHKRNFNANAQIKGDKGLKYREIIKPLFSQTHDTKLQLSKGFTKPKIGGFIPLFKNYKKNTDYVYWDDPNELIERLKLLVASKCAGNTNHNNEIVSIIEELKEAGIVKE